VGSANSSNHGVGIGSLNDERSRDIAAAVEQQSEVTEVIEKTVSRLPQTAGLIQRIIFSASNIIRRSISLRTIWTNLSISSTLEAATDLASLKGCLF
jgi:hypothetical protein